MRLAIRRGLQCYLSLYILTFSSNLNWTPKMGVIWVKRKICRFLSEILVDTMSTQTKLILVQKLYFVSTLSFKGKTEISSFHVGKISSWFCKYSVGAFSLCISRENAAEHSSKKSPSSHVNTRSYLVCSFKVGGLNFTILSL